MLLCSECVLGVLGTGQNPSLPTLPTRSHRKEPHTPHTPNTPNRPNTEPTSAPLRAAADVFEAHGAKRSEQPLSDPRKTASRAPELSTAPAARWLSARLSAASRTADSRPGNPRGSQPVPLRADKSADNRGSQLLLVSVRPSAARCGVRSPHVQLSDNHSPEALRTAHSARRDRGFLCGAATRRQSLSVNLSHELGENSPDRT